MATSSVIMRLNEHIPIRGGIMPRRIERDAIVQPPDQSIRYVPLTQGYVAIVDAEDYERVSQFKWVAAVIRRKDGTIRNVYAQRNIPWSDRKGATQRMHRFISGLSDSKIQGDHKNHNGLDNRRDNLRSCDNTRNCHNTRLRPSSTSGAKGVSWDDEAMRWRARITVNGKVKHLGRFGFKEQAAAAYNEAAKKYFGEFAHLNKI